MKKITSRVDLLENLRNLLALEMSARDSYILDIEEFSDGEIKKMIDSVKKDEDKHIKLIYEMIELF